MGTYVVGDIHGCFEEWISFRDKILDIDDSAEFIFVGDLIDRGNDSLKMLDFAMKNVRSHGQYQMVIGNHEYSKLRDLKVYSLRNFTKESIENMDEDSKLMVSLLDRYGFFGSLIHEKITSDKAKEIYDFWMSLSYYIEKKINGVNFIIAHAFINSYCLQGPGVLIPNEYLDDGMKHDIVWERVEPEKGFFTLKDTILIHGHTPTLADSFKQYPERYGKIFFAENRINVDCGIVFKHAGFKEANLAAIRLEDLEEFYLYDTPRDEILDEAKFSSDECKNNMMNETEFSSDECKNNMMKLFAR